MPAYDGVRYDPPAPVAEVRLQHPSGGASVEHVFMLIDSGADVTLLPRRAVEHIGVSPRAGIQFELVGFDGSRSLAQAVELDMIFLSKRFRGQYLVIDDEHGVLGRDVLAAVVLLLNGPKREWAEQRLGAQRHPTRRAAITRPCEIGLPLPAAFADLIR